MMIDITFTKRTKSCGWSIEVSSGLHGIKLDDACHKTVIQQLRKFANEFEGNVNNACFFRPGRYVSILITEDMEAKPRKRGMTKEKVLQLMQIRETHLKLMASLLFDGAVKKGIQVQARRVQQGEELREVHAVVNDRVAELNRRARALVNFKARQDALDNDLRETLQKLALGDDVLTADMSVEVDSAIHDLVIAGCAKPQNLFCRTEVSEDEVQTALGHNIED